MKSVLRRVWYVYHSIGRWCYLIKSIQLYVLLAVQLFSYLFWHSSFLLLFGLNYSKIYTWLYIFYIWNRRFRVSSYCFFYLPPSFIHCFLFWTNLFTSFGYGVTADKRLGMVFVLRSILYLALKQYHSGFG